MQKELTLCHFSTRNHVADAVHEVSAKLVDHPGRAASSKVAYDTRPVEILILGPRRRIPRGCVVAKLFLQLVSPFSLF